MLSPSQQVIVRQLQQSAGSECPTDAPPNACTRMVLCGVITLNSIPGEPEFTALVISPAVITP